MSSCFHIGSVGKNGHHEDFAMPEDELQELFVDVQERLEDATDTIDDAVQDKLCSIGRSDISTHVKISLETLRCWEECFERFAAHKRLTSILAPTRKTMRELLQSTLDGDFEASHKYFFEYDNALDDDDNNSKCGDDVSTPRSLSTASESESDPESRERFRNVAKYDFLFLPRDFFLMIIILRNYRY